MVPSYHVLLFHSFPHGVKGRHPYHKKRQVVRGERKKEDTASRVRTIRPLEWDWEPTHVLVFPWLSTSLSRYHLRNYNKGLQDCNYLRAWTMSYFLLCFSQSRCVEEWVLLVAMWFWILGREFQWNLALQTYGYQRGERDVGRDEIRNGGLTYTKYYT